MQQIVHLSQKWYICGMKIAEAIKGCRTSMGWSQGELSVNSGVSRGTICSIEGGRHGMDFGTVLKLLHAMGMKLVIVRDDIDG